VILVTAALIPVVLPLAAAGIAGFFAFVTTVPAELDAVLLSLTVLPFVALATGAARFVRLLAATVVVATAGFEGEAFRTGEALRICWPAREVLAFSTIPAKTIFVVPAGFSGEVGRAMSDFPGEERRPVAPSRLKGDAGSVRELFDLGERTCDAATALDAVRLGTLPVAAPPLARFFGTFKSCCVFSLSIVISISSLVRLVPLACCAGFGGSGLPTTAFGDMSVFDVVLALVIVFVAFRVPVLVDIDSAYFSNSSPMFAFLKLGGIRLTRSSILVLMPCACKAYCARSFRARSVTISNYELDAANYIAGTQR
jgi:hypothetical protein